MQALKKLSSLVPYISLFGLTTIALAASPPSIATSQDAYEVTIGESLSFSVTGSDGDGDLASLIATNISEFVGATFEQTGVESAFLLDQFPDAYAAYALRKLSSTYAGNAIEVRRASDNTVQAIGFNELGNLDTNALTTFCAGTDCFVTTWYNQTGEGGDLAQSTTSRQPKIVSAGQVIVNENEKPRMEYDISASSGLSTTTLPTAISTHSLTAFFAQQYDWSGSSNSLLIQLGTEDKSYNWLRYHLTGNRGAIRIGSGPDAPSFYSGDMPRTLHPGWRTIQVLDLNGQTARAFRNLSEVENKSHSLTAVTQNQMHIAGYDGYISEVILYPALSDADRTTVYHNINNYHLTGPTSVHETALLPQSWQYQVDIYDWLETITQEDVAVTPANLQWDGTYSNVDQLAKMWAMLGSSSRSEYQTTNIIRAESKWFVLDDGAGAGIEGAGRVKLFRFPSEAAFWYSQSLPLASGGQGNPYYQNEAVCKRALISAAVDLVMHDDLQDSSPEYWSNVDFAGGTMNGGILAYRTCEHILDDKTRAAFEDGYAYMAWKFLHWGSHDINSNMDTKSIAALAHAYATVEDERSRDIITRAAKKILFGSDTGTPATTDGRGAGIYHKAGYIGEASGPETTYNGVSLFYLQEAQAATRDFPEWDFMDEVVRSMVDFKVHQYFRDPSGYWDGPSGYANRTGNSYVYDQRDPSWRNLTAAATFTEGRPLARDVKFADGTSTLASAEDMVSTIQQTVSLFNSNYSIGTASAALPVNWGEEHWPTDNWYTPADGWYGTLKPLVDANDQSIIFPFERTADLNKTFDNEFWAYKNNDGTQDFGFFVESVERPGPYSGWYGGSLQTFWTKTAGMLILARHDKTGNEFPQENTQVWSEIDKWATHHVWGKDDSATPAAFSTASTHGYDHTVTYNINAATPSVSVATTLGNGSNKGQQTAGIISGATTFTNTFEAMSDGLRITSTIASDGADQAKELWTTLPVYLRDTGSQASLADTTIQYWDGSTWQPMDASLHSTQYIRLGRDFGSGPQYAWLVFEEAQSVKLSGSVWVQNYQNDTRIRNIHIDLHGNPGTAQTLPASKSIRYRIQTTDPGLVATGASASIQYPEVGDVLPVDGVWAAKAAITWNSGGEGAAYLEYSTNNGTNWTEVSEMTGNGDGTYQYVGGTIPSGLTNIRVRAVDGASNETNTGRAITSAATNQVFYDTFTAADGTAVDANYSAWDVNTTGNSYEVFKGTIGIQSNRAVGTNEDSWGNTVAINIGKSNAVIKGILNRAGVAEGHPYVIGRVSRYYQYVGAGITNSGFTLFVQGGESTSASHAIETTKDYTVHLQLVGRVATASFYDGETKITDLALFNVTSTASSHGFRLWNVGRIGDNLEILTW